MMGQYKMDVVKLYVMIYDIRLYVECFYVFLVMYSYCG